jgi:hypothetical protein
MITRLRYLLLLFLSLFILNIQAKEEAKEPYLVRTKDFNVIDFGLKKIDLGITAVIFNPYKAKAKIDEIVIDVYVEDKKLGNILEVPDIIKIPKNDTFDLPLKIAVNTGPTLTKFATESARLAMGKAVKVQYKGYIKMIAIGFIPIKVKIDETEYFTWNDIFKKDTKQPTPVPVLDKNEKNIKKN